MPPLAYFAVHTVAHSLFGVVTSWPFATRSAALMEMYSADELIRRTTSFSRVLVSTFWSSSRRPLESNLLKLLIIWCLLNIIITFSNILNLSSFSSCRSVCPLISFGQQSLIQRCTQTPVNTNKRQSKWTCLFACKWNVLLSECGCSLAFHVHKHCSRVNVLPNKCYYGNVSQRLICICLPSVSSSVRGEPPKYWINEQAVVYVMWMDVKAHFMLTAVALDQNESFKILSSSQRTKTMYIVTRILQHFPSN